MPLKHPRPIYDADMMDLAITGITHKEQKAKAKFTFVKKRSIDFTAEMWSIIEAHRNREGVTDGLRETIYRGLELLRERENL